MAVPESGLGTVGGFTMSSADSKIALPASHASRVSRTVDPAGPADWWQLSAAASYTRKVVVYVPKQYARDGSAVYRGRGPGPDRALFTALDNLIANDRVHR